MDCMICFSYWDVLFDGLDVLFDGLHDLFLIDLLIIPFCNQNNHVARVFYNNSRSLDYIIIAL